MAQDPLNPIHQSEVIRIIAQESKLAASSIPEGAPLPQGEKRQGIGIFDCKDNKQLDAIGNLLKKENLLEASAGCAGFAKVLMMMLPFAQRGSFERNELIPDRPLLVLSGASTLFLSGKLKKQLPAACPW
jgi:uncharacterized protein YgbK (DUF1537 family)